MIFSEELRKNMGWNWMFFSIDLIGKKVGDYIYFREEEEKK